MGANQELGSEIVSVGMESFYLLNWRRWRGPQSSSRISQPSEGRCGTLYSYLCAEKKKCLYCKHRRVRISRLQKPICSSFWAQARKWPQEASTGPFCSHFRIQARNGPRKRPETHFFAISEPKLGNGLRQPPEAQFYPFPSPTQEMVPGSLERLVFNNFRAQGRKWPQEDCRGPILPTYNHHQHYYYYSLTRGTRGKFFVYCFRGCSW